MAAGSGMAPGSARGWGQSRAGGPPGGGHTRGSAGTWGAPSLGSGLASSRQSSAGCPLPLTLPIVSSLAKLWVHQILVVLLPFLGLSAAAEGCE